MAFIRCTNGHFYNADIEPTCPYCKMLPESSGATVPLRPDDMFLESLMDDDLDLEPETGSTDDLAPVAQSPEDLTPAAQKPQDLAPVAQSPEYRAPAAQKPVDPAPVAQEPKDVAPAAQKFEDLAPVAQKPEELAPQPPKLENLAPAAQEPEVPAPVAQKPEEPAPVAQKPDPAPEPRKPEVLTSEARRIQPEPVQPAKPKGSLDRGRWETFPEPQTDTKTDRTPSFFDFPSNDPDSDLFSFMPTPSVPLQEAVDQAVSSQPAPAAGPAKRGTIPDDQLSEDDDEPDPVVGWLVCIKGEHFGESFVLKSGRNQIGRSPSMDVALTRDKKVSMLRQASVIYEPRAVIFIAQPGDSRELAYLNYDVLLSTQNMKPRDILHIGKEELLFVPLCGQDFSWDDYSKD